MWADLSARIPATCRKDPGPLHTALERQLVLLAAREDAPSGVTGYPRSTLIPRPVPKRNTCIKRQRFGPKRAMLRSESAAVRVGRPASPHGPAGPASESSGRRWREKWTRSQCGWQERGLGDRGSGPWCGWGGESAGAVRGETVQEPELTSAQAGQGPPRRSGATPQGGGHVSLGTK